MEEQLINTNAEQSQENSFRYFPFFNKKQSVFALVLIGIIFYCTSLYNEFALDDSIVIHQNNYVLQGARGIKNILTKDGYDAFYKRMNASDQLQGGRYRPIAAISYALEQEIIGTYRTGYYMYVEDINQNGKLDNEKVEQPRDTLSNSSSQSGFTVNDEKDLISKRKPKPLVVEYEYNDFVDLNKDGIAQANECYACWDTNKNFKDDNSEDINHDGVLNEYDCHAKGSMLRHFNNVWLYVLACVLLYLVFSKYMFKNNQDIAFLAALIFLIHPVHSEVVANVKGRDDIFGLIFISLTFLFSFKFIEHKKIGSLLAACLMLFLALMSKEFAIMLLLLVPLALYVFSEAKRKETGKLVLGLFVSAIIYIGIRLCVVNIVPAVPDTEILNNPYLLASGEEKTATKIFIFLKYLVLSVFPATLTSDYSYNSIPYRNFADVGVITSLLLNLTLLVLGIWLTIKKHPIGFAIITYYVFLLLVSNFFFDVGATMHESFLFHSIIGVAMIFAWLIIKGFDKIKNASFAAKRTTLLSLLLVILVLCGCKVWERNWDWKNDVTLFLKDVKTSPNSVLVLGNAGARWIDLADTKEITGIPLPGQDSLAFNDYNGQLRISDEEMIAGAYKNKREAALQKGIAYLKHAVELHPRYVNGFLNLGLAHYKLGEEKEAIIYWKMAERLYPNNPYLRNYYDVATSIISNRGKKALDEGRLKNAIHDFKLCTLMKPEDAEVWNNLGDAFEAAKNFTKAKECFEKAAHLDPQNPKPCELLKEKENPC